MKEKARYGILSNVVFMLRTALGTCKSVPVFVAAEALLAVAENILSLFFAPAVLTVIESRGTVYRLCMTVLLFAGGIILLRSVLSYCRTNHIFGRIEVRMSIIMMIGNKTMQTSYLNLEEQAFNAQKNKANQCCQGNSEATEAVWQTLQELLQCLLGFALYLGLLASLNFFIVAAVLLTTVAGFIVTNRVSLWKYRHREEEERHIQHINYVMNTGMSRDYAKDIRLFGMQSWLEELYRKHLRLYRRFQLKGEKRYFIADLTDILLTAARNGIAYYWLVSLVISRTLTIPEFVLYFSAVGSFTQWINGILNQLSVLHKQSLDLSCVREFLNYKEYFLFKEGRPVPLAEKNVIELKNVSFRYPQSEALILDSINLKLEAGEKIAVVGLNGAGKTTLVKLITGLYDPSEGQVLINGVDVKTLNRQEYYRAFSAVFQEHSLLPLSIALNIAQTAENTDMDRVHECLKRSGLYEKVQSLPQKAETRLCKDIHFDATELSGGETQKLLLARALYRNCPFLILDEPTAALDPIAEHELYTQYNSLAADKTSIFISHRLASTRFCDRILFLQNGAIIEEGSHQELLALNGAYSNLFAVQSKYYQEKENE